MVTKKTKTPKKTTNAKTVKEKPFAFAEDDSLKFVCLSGDGLYGKFGFGHTCDEAIDACKRAGAKLGAHGFYVKVTDSKSLTVGDDGSLGFYMTEKFPHGPKYAATKRHGPHETFFYEPYVEVPMKEDVKLADLTALEQRRPVTWLGWALFCCEQRGVASPTPTYGYRCCLFPDDAKPEAQPDDQGGGGWLSTGGVFVPPQFLDACGLDVSWREPMVSQFYQAQDCRHNTHPPIRIALTLPRELLQALKLLPED